jgi:hypothetical protein
MDSAIPVTPPRVEAFHAFGGPAGHRSARLEIGTVAVELEGLPEDLADRMDVAYAPYIGPATGAGRPLRIEVVSAPLEYFVPPGFAGGWEVYRMVTALCGRTFLTASYRLASWFDLDALRGQVALASGDLDPAPRAMENFLRAGVAWMAVERDGFFLHGASIVRRGRAYLFYGPSGAGKSTLAAMNREGEVISDDLTLVLRRPEGLMAAGGPFRGTYRRGSPVVGLFPVAGLYRLRKDDRTAVEHDDGGCFADLVGNLPFVVDQLPGHPELMDRVRSLVAGARFAYLRFRKDADVWPAIDAAAPAGLSL